MSDDQGDVKAEDAEVLKAYLCYGWSQRKI